MSPSILTFLDTYGYAYQELSAFLGTELSPDAANSDHNKNLSDILSTGTVLLENQGWARQHHTGLGGIELRCG